MKRSVVVGIAGGAFLGLSAPALADCVDTGQCQMVSAGQSVNVNAPGGFSPSCLAVTNNCGVGILVPMGSQSEWNNFNSYHPACIGVAGCPAPCVGYMAHCESATCCSPIMDPYGGNHYDTASCQCGFGGGCFCMVSCADVGVDGCSWM